MPKYKTPIELATQLRDCARRAKENTNKPHEQAFYAAVEELAETARAHEAGEVDELEEPTKPGGAAPAASATTS